MKNPLDHIAPDFTIFGAQFTTIWQKLAAGLWGLGILIAVGYLGHGISASPRTAAGIRGSCGRARRRP